ncbi:MAG: hypothetical protein Q8M51_03905 [Polaromonas sp.]|uniref:hypothetical protein n=1 Tax=Polaromonas sp. TaxID=1869339 RepID=UPI00272F3336|nr:hypothetical protein [Polaromonas sp.]MDP1739512.1 hypothetical protein [Polaromonas sp.]MDP1953086.1 hypothetical protein [Polaromonas sp.]MDP3354990.1 hypothetical protein [Polaromonas sp.]MDP3750311.1 hypothetical protein [Polaromonas sp.]
MTDADLDTSYSALCEALAQVGEGKAPLLLAMLCLSLMSRAGQAGDVLPLITNALLQCADDAAEPARAT